LDMEDYYRSVVRPSKTIEWFTAAGGHKVRLQNIDEYSPEAFLLRLQKVLTTKGAVFLEEDITNSGSPTHAVALIGIKVIGGIVFQTWVIDPAEPRPTIRSARGSKEVGYLKDKMYELLVQ